VRHPDRNAVFVGELECATGMVVVFVGNDNSRQAFGLNSQPVQSGNGVTQAEAAIQQEAGAGFFDQQAITGATAPE
jgi:hypothetical protein